MTQLDEQTAQQVVGQILEQSENWIDLTKSDLTKFTKGQLLETIEIGQYLISGLLASLKTTIDRVEKMENQHNG